jgi:holo-[acyl-carrier protein] synthase
MYVKRTVLRKLDDVVHIIKSADGSKGLENIGCFTMAELNYCSNRMRCLGARFIIKECVLDYLTKEMGYIKRNFKEIEIVSNEFKKPMIKLYDDIRECVRKLKIKNILISISHSRNWIAGMVIFCY